MHVVAQSPAACREHKYTCIFFKIVLDTWGPRGLNLIKMIGNKMKEATGEPRSTFYLFQKISMAIQRGNSQCTLGTSSNSKGLDEIFDFIDHNYGDD